MPNNSTPGQTLSLPKGGGALHGIGEKFSPDLHTGTGNFTVPIALPPGRNSFQPELSLVYSTGNGNGPFGLGWSLSVPGVSRKTSKGVPLYDDSKDIFILSGAEDLVPVERLPGTTRYRPRTEGLFARIQRYRDTADDYWEVRSKDGLVSLYGTPNATPNDPATIAKPADGSRVFAWKLARTTDPFGNRIEYRYERDAVQSDGPHQWDQLYLSEIRYVDYGDPAASQFLVTVRFVYEERPDPFSDYRAGFEIRTVRRCVRIEVSTHPGTDTPVRTYHLDYLDQRNLPEQLPPNGVSLLSQVRVEGHDGPASEWLPPLEFGYTRFEPEKRDFAPITGPDMPPGSLARPDYELADLFGNGLPDVLEMNGTVRYWRNLGAGRFDLPREMRSAPAGLGLADKGVQLLDANGDGRIDLLVTTQGLAGYYPLQFGGLWDRRSFQPYRLIPSFDLKDPEVRLVDLDGDGVTDAIRSGSRLECFFNDPQEGWNGTRWVERRALEDFPNVNFSDPRVKWADMTGDGLQDVVLVHDGSIEYWPSLGRGDWGKRVSMRHSPRFPYGYDPRRILVSDVDGDGLADLVYVDDTKVTLWINRSGNAWSDPITVHGTPPVSDVDAVRLADMCGTGISGVLWSADAGGLSRATMFFLDFTGAIKPYLLNQMDNHIGSLTRVVYAPSTQFYLDDEKRTETRWKTPLPFPVQVVARVEAIDAVSGGKLRTEYSYHHGYWDGAEREFRGFGRVDQRDAEVFQTPHPPDRHPARVAREAVPQTFSPPTETRTWFHQGPIGDEFGEWEETDFSGEFWPGDPQALSRPPTMIDFLKGLPRRVKRDALRTLRGRVLRTELYALDGKDLQDRLYTVTEHLHGVREESAPGPAEAGRQHCFFSHTLAERTTQWERGPEPMTRFTFTGDYDAYGQPRSQISIAVPRGRDFRVSAAAAEPYLATQTVTTYAQRDDAQRYIVDRVARATTYEIPDDGKLPNNPRPALFDLRQAIESGTAARTVIGQSLSYYDGPAFQGLPFGQLGSYGAVARTESLVLTADILHRAYKTGSAVSTLPEEPSYLATGGPPVWPAEYPQEFRTLLPPLAGYTYHPGGAEYEPGYFAATTRRRYDFHEDPGGLGRGLPRATRDPLGNETTIAYDRYSLLPTVVTDPVGLVTQASYDYRVLQPSLLTEPNGNRTAYAFTPLGLPASIAVMGKAGEPLGDTPETPGARFAYSFTSFVDAGRPISVHTTRRVHHVSETDVPQPQRDETIETFEYSDGFGRLVQTRTQAEDVAFGDPAFGGGVLPDDQTVVPGDSVGRQRAPGDPPRVVVSGWQTYDNKGRVVEKYEPFFSAGWDYLPRTDAGGDVFGQKAQLYYDPRGQVIRTVNPDGSEQRVVHGVPGTIAAPDLTNPDVFEPTPWEAYTYDANDNAGRTHPTTASGYQQHWNTPASAVVDALGRTVKAVERNGSNPATDWYTTRSTYDIHGNLLTVTDPLGRVAFRHTYDLANRALRVESLDAGIRRTIVDAAGNTVEGRDSKGSLILHAYDPLSRPIRLWARDDGGSPVTLRDRIEYGDGGDRNQPAAMRNANRALNLLGKVQRHYDEAGLLSFAGYDFKGNVLEKARQVIGDDQILSAFKPAPSNNWLVQVYRVDWQPPAGVTLPTYAARLLDATPYQTSLTYDALNRVKAMRYPQDVGGARKTLRPGYNRAGALERVELDGAPYVERIAYNAKGQRTLIAYGNGVMTRYAYDARTFHLARLRTEPYTKPAGAPLTFHPARPGKPLQDFAYSYDLVGNILSLRDRTPACGVINNPDAVQVTDPVLAQLLAAGDALIRRFEYDPLYRLRSATGRQCKTIPDPWPWTDDQRCAATFSNYTTPGQDNAPNLTATYREDYAYDPAGNMVSRGHRTPTAAWTRQFGMGGLTPQQWSQEWPKHLGATAEWSNPPSNRLTHVGDNGPGLPQTHRYDANGNLVRETTSRRFEWDHSDRLRLYLTQPDNAKPSVYAYYLYDAAGQRVKKVVGKEGSQVEVTVYVDGVFEYRRFGSQANNTLHVMDNQKRIALVRVGSPLPGDTSPDVQYHLGDHLGSSNVVIDGAGAWINREEYTPYGETSFGSFAKKRYRFSGKERDEESGLYYHWARYYAPWLARWVSCDPAGMVDGANVYAYGKTNPIRFVDRQGTQTGDWAKDYNNLSPRERVEYNARAQAEAQIEQTGSPQEKLALKVSGHVSLQSRVDLPMYYSAQARELDKSPLPWIFETGWKVGELIWGETLSGHSIDRVQQAIDVGVRLIGHLFEFEMVGDLAKLAGAGSRSLGLDAAERLGMAPTTPTVTKTAFGDEIQYKATWGEDPKAFAMFTPAGTGVQVSDLFRGGQPKGTGGIMLADALRQAGIEQPSSIRFTNIMDEQPTLAELARGTPVQETVLGKTLSNTVKELKGTATGWSQGVDDRGKPWIEATISYGAR